MVSLPLKPLLCLSPYNSFVHPNPYSSALIGGGLENKLLLLLERNAELEQFSKDVRKVLEEEVIILRVPLNVLPKLLVFDECHVGWKHHKRFGRDVLELLWSIPLLPGPLLLKQELVVIVCQHRWREGPGAYKGNNRLVSKLIMT